MAISETIEIDAGPGIEQLNALAESADRAAEALDKIKIGAVSGGGADKLAASMSAAADKISQAAAKASEAMGKISGAADSAAGGVGRLGEAAGAAAGGLRDASASADAMAVAGDRVAESSDAAAVSLERQAVAGGKAGESSAKAAESGGTFWKGLSTVMLGAGVAAAYGIDKAMKFQSEMLLLHTQAGVSTKDTATMSQGVLQISTQTGQSLSAVAESAYHVASNMESMKGSSPAKMLQAVKIAAEGAAVGHSNLVDTTNAMTAAISSNIPGVKNYSQAMGVLNATVGSGDMKMQDLAEAFGGGMVAVVKGYGLSLKDVGAALATFGDNNIRGAKAGTDLRMAVQALAVPMKTAPLSKFGLDMNTLAKDMQSGGLNKALLDLTGRFHKAGLTAKTEGEWITALFGKKAGAGVAVLLEQMDRLESKYPQLTKNANNFNAAWAATQASPAQKWKEAVAGLQASATGFGTQLLPAFSGALGFADKLLASINGSKSGARDIAVAFGGIAALFTAKKLTSGIESAFSTAEAGVRVLGKVGQTLGIPGSGGLANLGKSGSAGAAGSLDRVAGAGDAAAASLDRVAGAGDKAAIGEDAAGAGGAKAAIGEDAAAAGGSKLGKGGGVLGAAGTVAIGAMISVGIDQWLKSQKNGQGNWLDNAFGTPKTSAWNSWGTAFHNSIAGNVSRAWGQAGPVQSAANQSQFESRFGIGVPGAAQAAKIPAPDLSGLESAKSKVQAAMASINKDIESAKAAKLPAPDISALESAKGVIKADLNSINTELGAAAKPSKMASPDMSALASAKATAAQSAAGIHTAAQTPLQKPVKAVSPDLSALASAKGTAAADGANLSAGFAAGILANEGAVVAAANRVAQAASAAMRVTLDSHSPSKVTQKIGADAVDGLVVGLEGGQAAVTAASQALGKQVAKAADVTAIDTAITKGIKDAGKDSALVRFLKGDQAKLLSLSAQRTALETQITDSQQIAQQAISGANITGAGTYTPVLAASDGPLAASSTVTGMQQMAADQKQFAQVISQLGKQGLNATSLNQFVQAGSSSLPQALGLAQGGKGAIGQVNAAESSIQASAAKLGDTGGAAMYQAGVQAAQGLAAGLKSQLSSVDAAIAKMASSITTAIKKALKISSPSGVFRELGMTLPQGMAQGVDAGSAIAESAASRMGNRVAQAAHQGGGTGGGGGGGTTIIHVTVQGTVVSQQQLGQVVQQALLTKGNSNWQAGLVLPGRRT